MARYKISLLGLYQYSDTLFAYLDLPTFDDMPNPDKDTLISLILEKASDFPCLYPDFDFMQYMCGVWSKNCAFVMEKLWKTQYYEYNPIHNYDRTGTITRVASSSGNGTVTAGSTAFNSDTFKNTGRTQSNDASSGTETVTENVSGNIGVMSTQQMIEQERDVSMFKWYDIVSDDFINKFCVQIY